VSLEKRRYNILCLSGGGYRGLFSAALLDSIERGYRLQSLASHFDLIIGTSTGGLVAAGLAGGLPPSRIVRAFEAHGSRIFPSHSDLRRAYRKLTFRSQYDPKRIRSAVHAILGDLAKSYIEELPGPLALVTVSRMTQSHRIFCSKPFAERGITPTRLGDALLATTAAPTYFPEHKIEFDWLIDGGLAANAPSLIGISLLRRKLALPAEKIHVLHIGTASPSTPQSFDRHGLYSFGPRALWRRAMNTTRDLVLLTIEAQESLAMEIAQAWIGDRYVYIDASDEDSQGDELTRLDNATPEATKKLRWLAEQTWLQWQDQPMLRSFFGTSQPMVQAPAAAQPLPRRSPPPIAIVR
jgi:patatin-like phospholipase/acyl hydrolase